MEVKLQAIQSPALEHGKSPTSIFGHFTEGNTRQQPTIAYKIHGSL